MDYDDDDDDGDADNDYGVLLCADLHTGHARSAVGKNKCTKRAERNSNDKKSSDRWTAKQSDNGVAVSRLSIV